MAGAAERARHQGSSELKDVCWRAPTTTTADGGDLATGNYGAPAASQSSMTYRLDAALLDRRARLLDAPSTPSTRRRLAIVEDLIAGRSPASHVELRTPCREDWGAMAGGDETRRCVRCDHDVHDLDLMAPRDVAELLLDRSDGCVRFRRPDDRVVDARCPRPPLPWERVGIVTAALAITGAVGMWLAHDEPRVVIEGSAPTAPPGRDRFLGPAVSVMGTMRSIRELE